MFAYCLNNPVNLSDCAGDFAIPAAVIVAIKTAAIYGLVDGFMSAVSTYLSTDSREEALQAFGWDFFGGAFSSMSKKAELGFNMVSALAVTFDCLDNGVDYKTSILVGLTSFVSNYTFEGIELQGFAKGIFKITFEFGSETTTNAFIEVIQGMFNKPSPVIANFLPPVTPPEKPTAGAAGGSNGYIAVHG